VSAQSQVCGTLLSLNVGLPKDVPWQGTAVYTGVYKAPVQDPRMVRRLNVDGDGQGDLAGHGGEQRAVLVYQQGSYDHWAQHLSRDDLVPGSFGENFTVDGLADNEVCIGDRYRIGGAEFEVSQPRVTCFRVGMRLGEPQMPALLVSHRRPGFYLRVISEGKVKAGDSIVKTRTGPHALTVADIDGLLYLPDRDEATLQKAVRIPALSPGWQQSFRELLDTDLSTATVTGPMIGFEPSWDGFRRMTVTKVVHETPTITSVYLGAGDGVALQPPLPGQYLTLRVAAAATPAIRSYSISAIPDEHSYRISVRREEHGLVSRYLNDVLAPGAIVDVAAPRGEFTLADGPEPVILLSAGVGATPVLAMLHELARVRSTREIWWIQTARNAEEHAFAAEARALLDQLAHARTATFYTRAASTSGDAISGRPDLEGFRALNLPTNATVYLCGPTPFTVGITATLATLGFAQERIHSELFGTLPPINPGVVAHAVVPPHAPAGEPGTGPTVTFARSGLTVSWREGDASLLDLAEACDVPTRWSCRSGVCHTCVTAVIDGAVSYRPDPLELPPDGQALVCCARPVGDLVLDS
jgi:ferredoxin-NADP reductase/MOSC domain-containing protein YiiM